MKKTDFHNKWIGVDLDGTLAHYDEFRGDDHVGKPITSMVERVRDWLAKGYEVRIFTARKPHPAIREFCARQFGKVLRITNTKDSGMIAFIDDRGVNARRNTGEVDEKALKQVGL